MGQKIHPELFRINIFKNYKSNWYSTKFIYSKLIKEDYMIRNIIQEKLNELAIISEIKILRSSNFYKEFRYIVINIDLLLHEEDDLLDKFATIFNISDKEISNASIKQKIKLINLLIKYYIRNLVRQIQYKYNVYVYISKNILEHPFQNSNLIAKYIGDQLQKRIPYKRILKNIFQYIDELNLTYGIKIQISGRLNGQEMARTEWQQEGQLSLNTLRKKINYSFYPTKTIYGIMGVKVWLYQK